MPVSESTTLRNKIRELCDPDNRVVPMAARLRVYRRSDKGLAEPAELLDRVYGGYYDRLQGGMTPGIPEDIKEVSCHAGQLPLLLFEPGEAARVLALGSPGGGKTAAIIRKALLLCLDHPNTCGGLVAPTNDRRQILWREFIELVEGWGWIQSCEVTKKEILLKNNCLLQVLAAKRPSIQHGNPLQGKSWDWCCVDESQNIDDDSQIEIDTRGRRVGTKYCVFESATNAQIPAFRVRLEHYKQSKIHRVIRYGLEENPWVEKEYQERLKGLMSDRDYRERILCEDLPPELLIYPKFSFEHNIKPIPAKAIDITSEVVEERYGRKANYIVAQDFGILVSASIILKCYAGSGRRDRVWYAIDELTSYSGTTADIHARKLLQKYNADELICIADPHFNSKESDKSDYNMFRQAGIDIHPAVHGQIPRKHRIAMLNSLLEDGNGQRRFYIESDDQRRTKCPRLTEAFLTMSYGPNGEEAVRKNYTDRTHWPCAVGYGVFPWERIRGAAMATVIRPEVKVWR